MNAGQDLDPKLSNKERNIRDGRTQEERVWVLWCDLLYIVRYCVGI